MSDQANTNPPIWTCGDAEYTVETRDGVYLAPGDETTDFRGNAAQITSVERGPEYNGTAKVIARRADREYNDYVYATVFDLIVTRREVGQ